MSLLEFLFRGFIMAINMNIAIYVFNRNSYSQIILNLFAIVSIILIWGYPMGSLIANLANSSFSFNNVIILALFIFFVYTFLILSAVLLYTIFYIIWRLDNLHGKWTQSIFIIMYILSIAIWTISKYCKT